LSIGGNAANVTGTVGLTNGGTGQITANASLNALLPTQTGNGTKFLQTDGSNTTWAAATAGAAGSTTQIQYNNAGSMAGSANLTYDSTGNTLSLLGTDAELVVNGVTTEPTAASAGQVKIYAKDQGGRMFPKWVGPSGIDCFPQPHYGFATVRLVTPSTGAVLNTINLAVTQVGTFTTPALAAGNMKAQVKRFLIPTTTTAGNVAGIRSTATECWRGNAAGQGGFFYSCRFGLEGALVAGMRAFVGIQDVITAPTNVDPTTSTTPGKFGMAINTNSGNWNFVTNLTGSAPTVTALGANFPVDLTTLFELTMFAAPNGSQITYRVTNLTTNATAATGTITTNLPASATFLAPHCWITNNATAAAATLAVSRIYLETDS
jgi:hypothetical protein